MAYKRMPVSKYRYKKNYTAQNNSWKRRTWRAAYKTKFYRNISTTTSIPLVLT